MIILNYFVPVLIAWLFTSTALISGHLFLWSQPWRLSRVASYAFGTIVLSLGMIIWALLTPEPVYPLVAAASFAAIASSGGWIIVAYWLRDCLAVIHHDNESRKHVRAKLRAALGDMDGTIPTKPGSGAGPDLGG